MFVRRGSCSIAGVLVPALLMACAPTGTNKPLRSPTRDYPAPPPTTSDGHAVGADGKDPADTLEEGATPSGPAPGWEIGEDGVEYDPERRTGGETEGEAEGEH
jgi:hypothetical protein